MIRSILSVLLASTLLSGCSPPAEEEPGPLSPADHECQTYTPTVLTRTLNSRFTDPTDVRTAPIRAASDPGGGFIELSLTTDNPALSPGLIVTVLGGGTGAIIDADAVGTADPTTMRGGFSAAPDQAYELTFTQGLGVAPGDYPVAFTLTWTFTGTLDCYEANDTATEVKQVPVGTTIEAHALTGYTQNSLGAERYDDWYRFVLNRPATIEAALTVPPGDHRTRIRLWADDGTTALAAGNGAAGGETFSVSLPLGAGTYLLSMEVADPEPATWNREVLSPSFWTEPYTIELREVF